MRETDLGAQALCERIGMMSEGRLRCLGSAQHLKGRFGEGYVLDVKVAAAAAAEAEAVGLQRVAAVTAAVRSAVADEGADEGACEVRLYTTSLRIQLTHSLNAPDDFNPSNL
jgi:ABC-type multidrug transport system ATPase subunit